jgi:cation diffusion facilitator family transporter
MIDHPTTERPMHQHDPSPWTHDHVFDSGSQAAERGTRLVVVLTACMMVVEIVAGLWFNSMALLADGLHMSSHVFAIGLSAFAYAYARKFARDPRFAFGTWKIEILGGFTSALFLLGVAMMMVVASIERIVSPQEIHYQEAILVAVIGLLVNLASAVILGRAHDHDHAHGHGHHHGHHQNSHQHGHQHEDLNLKAAYVHVIADAATSVLAIVALIGGWLYGWDWLDPVMGIVGALLVAKWAQGLLVETSRILLDREMDHPVVAEVREAVETGPEEGDTRVTDLHVWRVGKGAYSCALSVVTHDRALTPAKVREQLAVHEEIVHSTIEIHLCPAAVPAEGVTH